MRGGCTVQQSLTPAALGVVRLAVSLAQQRGHAQVRPLHVAAVLLSSPGGLLRAGCLESHSHPLRFKALELCFNVALNRLPTTSSSSTSLSLSAYHHHPALSNALVAALKRTQSNQRGGRGAGGGSAVEVQAAELQQLVLSILDDPSVSRVMREAGFSSTQVKTNVERAVSNYLGIINSSPPLPLAKKARSSTSTSNQTSIRDEEYFTDSVIDSLLRLRRKNSSIVIVGESSATGEALRRIIQASREGAADDVLRDLQIANLSLISSSASREEVEEKVNDLSCHLAKGSRNTAIYMGNVERIAEKSFKLINGQGGGDDKYSPLEHAIVELGRLVSDGEGRIWLMGITTHEGYMGCISWLSSYLGSTVDVQPLFVPQDGCSLELSLSLNSSRNIVANGGGHGSRASNLPSWLQKLEEEEKEDTSGNASNQESLELNDVCKWSSSLNNPSHKKRLDFSWCFPLSSSSDHGFHHEFDFWNTGSEETHTRLHHEERNKANCSSAESMEAVERYYTSRFNELTAEKLNASPPPWTSRSPGRSTSPLA